MYTIKFCYKDHLKFKNILNIEDHMFLLGLINEIFHYQDHFQRVSLVVLVSGVHCTLDNKFSFDCLLQREKNETNNNNNNKNNQSKL